MDGWMEYKDIYLSTDYTKDYFQFLETNSFNGKHESINTILE